MFIISCYAAGTIGIYL